MFNLPLLFKDLNIDEEYFLSKLTKYGIEETIKIFGNDSSTSDNFLLAGRLSVYLLKQKCPKTLSEYLNIMKNRLSTHAYNFMFNHIVKLQDVMNEYEYCDYNYGYIAMSTFNRLYSYRMKYKDIDPVETPQFVWMRTAVELHYNSTLENVIETFKDLSIGYYTHASPTIFNAGLIKNQMSSCFLLSMEDDIDNISKNIGNCIKISQNYGGIGLDVSRLRHSEINNTGMSNGIIPLICVINKVINYANQCFTKDTFIFTDKGIQRIDRLNKGDLVLTRYNEYHPITQLNINHYDGLGVLLKTSTSFHDVKVTNDHVLYVIENDNNIRWKEAKDIDINDKMIVSLYKGNENESEVNNILYSEYEIIFYALTFDNICFNEDEITICISIEHYNFIIEYFKIYQIEYSENKDLESKVIFKFKNHKINNSLYIDENDYYMIHHSFTNLTKNNTLLLVYNMFRDKNSLFFENEKCAYLFCSLLLKVNLPFECSIVNNNKYIVKKSNNIIRIDDSFIIYSDIMNIENIKINEKVYDFEIEKEKNYTTTSCISHNGGKRRGSATIFLRIHHIDLLDFIDVVKKSSGDDSNRCHDINSCLWTSWIFWDRVKNDEKWTLFCPNLVPQLNDVYGLEFEKLYIKAENNPKYDKTKIVLKAREVLNRIVNVQRESSMPYIMNGDSANFKSNQKHLGYIRSSNLCLEIIEFTDRDNISSCNLCSLSLKMFAKDKKVDYHLLGNITKKVVTNLNQLIDNNYYPLDKKDKAGIINKTNKNYRPIGIGVSGLSDLIYLLDLHYEHPELIEVNKRIFACIYFNALVQSVELAIKDSPFHSFEDSPSAKGELQFDLWKQEYEVLKDRVKSRKKEDDEPVDPSSWNQKTFKLMNDDVIEPTWESLKEKIQKYGIRNSLLIALMPTATTAQIRGNCESIELNQSNLYSRNVLSGNFTMLNKYMEKDLSDIHVWNDITREYLVGTNGSLKGFANVVINNLFLFKDFDLKDKDRLFYIETKYKTSWEVSSLKVLELCAQRSRYIDQSTSFNLYMGDCKPENLKKYYYRAYELGIKTIIYYLRQRVKESTKFTENLELLKLLSKINKSDKEITELLKLLNKENISLPTSKKIECDGEECTVCSS